MLLTHFHLDHLLGLPLCPYLFSNADGRMTVCAGEHECVNAAYALSVLFAPPLWPVSVTGRLTFRTLEPDFSIGPVRVETMAGVHPNGISLLRLSAGGKRVVFATDEAGRVVPFDAEIELLVSALSSQAAISITNMQYSEQITALLDSFVGALSTAIDERSPYNANHTRNMVRLGEAFLDWLDEGGRDWRFDAEARRFLDEDGQSRPWLSDEEAYCLRVRRGTLTDEERAVMQGHVVVTDRILRHVKFPKSYERVPLWAAAHHELLNGSGYPQGLRGDAIPARCGC